MQQNIEKAKLEIRRYQEEIRKLKKEVKNN